MPTLADTPSHTTVVIATLAVEDALVHQLGVLGLLPDHLVTVVKNPRGAGPLVVESGSSRLALGREIARQITVIEKK